MSLQSICCVIVYKRKDVTKLGTTTKTITVRVDEKTKQQAEDILEDIGLNVTGLFNACLRAVVREKRVPFAMVSSEYEHGQLIKSIPTPSRYRPVARE